MAKHRILGEYDPETKEITIVISGSVFVTFKMLELIIKNMIDPDTSTEDLGKETLMQLAVKAFNDATTESGNECTQAQ